MTAHKKSSNNENPNESQEAVSITMKRLRHANHHSISNPQQIVEELKHKSKNNFTSSFQKLLTTYKKSKENHKSMSYGGNGVERGRDGGHSETILVKSRNNMFSKTKTSSLMKSDIDRDRRCQKSHKTLGSSIGVSMSGHR